MKKLIEVLSLLITVFVIGALFGYSYEHKKAKEKIAQLNAVAQQKLLEANAEVRLQESLLALAQEEILKRAKEKKNELQKKRDDLDFKLRTGYGMQVYLDSCNSRLPANSSASDRSDGARATGFLAKSDRSFLVSKFSRSDDIIANKLSVLQSYAQAAYKACGR